MKLFLFLISQFTDSLRISDSLPAWKMLLDITLFQVTRPNTAVLKT